MSRKEACSTDDVDADADILLTADDDDDDDWNANDTDDGAATTTAARKMGGREKISMVSIEVVVVEELWLYWSRRSTYGQLAPTKLVSPSPSQRSASASTAGSRYHLS